MFDFFMYLLVGGFFVWAAMAAITILLLPLYFWMLIFRAD